MAHTISTHFLIRAQTDAEARTDAGKKPGLFWDYRTKGLDSKRGRKEATINLWERTAV